MTRANLILVLTDQHRLSAIGAYGDTPCRTPHIDRLAAEGVLFERAYTTCPVCSPARASILTGLYPHAHGVTTNIRQISCAVHALEDRPTLLPRRLQAHGYQTGYLGKWHLGTESRATFAGRSPSSLPRDFGFVGHNVPGHGGAGYRTDAYIDWLRSKGQTLHIRDWAEHTRRIRPAFGILDMPDDCTVPAFLVDSAIQLIDDFKPNSEPFYLALNFWGPHAPYHATERHLAPYREIDIPPWPNFDWDSRGTPGPHHYKIHWDKEALTWDDWAMALRYYYARVSMIDEQIGRLYGHLQASGLLENTAILFAADHGETLGSHGGLLDKGWHHFEETHRIPLIIRMPGATSGGVRIPDFASLADIYPTLLDLARIDPPGTMLHGRSLMPYLQGQADEPRSRIVTEFLGHGSIATCMKSLRLERWKYGYNLTFDDELYDLENDPHETVNLASDPGYRDALEDARGHLEDWMVETRDPALRMFRWQQRKDPTVTR